MLDALSEREKQIVAHLAVGLRVTGVARELCVSEHTVRNHLKSAFSKLDLHSQSDLVDFVHANPSVVAPYDAIAGLASRSGRDMVAEIMEVDRATEKRVEAVAGSGSGLDQMKRIIRAVLPLDEARRREWRVRLETFARGPEQPAVQETTRALKRKWAEKPLQRIGEFQRRGWIASDLPPEEVRRQLASAVYAAVMALLAEPSPDEERRQLAAIDRLLEELASDESGVQGKSTERPPT